MHMATLDQQVNLHYTYFTFRGVFNRKSEAGKGSNDISIIMPEDFCYLVFQWNTFDNQDNNSETLKSNFLCAVKWQALCE